jgi:uncharacterized membrane protein
MRNAYVLSLVLIAISFSFSAYLYSSLPDTLASHWNERGEVNGYMPKFWAIFMVPMISFGIFALFATIPRIDPLKKNVAKFRGQFDFFTVIIVAFLIYTHGLTLLWNLGYAFNMGQLISPGFGALFYSIGMLLEKSKRNWFIGIRTPWTLSSDRVWDKTNRLGAKIFKAAGVISILSLALPEYGFIIVIGTSIAGAVFTVVYSYVMFRKK